MSETTDGDVPHIRLVRPNGHSGEPDPDSRIYITTSAGRVPIKADAIAQQQMYEAQVNSNRADRHQLCYWLAVLVAAVVGLPLLFGPFYTDLWWAKLFGPGLGVLLGASAGILSHAKFDDWLCVKPAHDNVYGPRS